MKTELFFIEQNRAVRRLPDLYFYGGTNSLSQSLTALPAPSEREPLAHPETLRFSWKLYRYAKGPILEGAGIAQR